MRPDRANALVFLAVAVAVPCARCEHVAPPHVSERCVTCECVERVASFIKYMYRFHNSVSRSRETYNALTNWLTDARMLASQSIVVILCGNKKDLDADREVTFLEASRFAQENGK